MSPNAGGGGRGGVSDNENSCTQEPNKLWTSHFILLLFLFHRTEFRAVFSSTEGFGTEFWDFLFRGTTGILSEITICCVYSVFREIIFLSEIPNPRHHLQYLQKLQIRIWWPGFMDPDRVHEFGYWSSELQARVKAAAADCPTNSMHLQKLQIQIRWLGFMDPDWAYEFGYWS